MKTTMKFNLITFFFATLCQMALAAGGDYDTRPRRVLDLRGIWKFELGDNMEWRQPDFDDSDWGKMFVPASWEDEGFPGYDGFAWYRRSFETPMFEDQSSILLDLGYIDDCSTVYLNGRQLGTTGSFPPYFQTGYNQHVVYRVPIEYFRKSGLNVLAVRVFDTHLAGGIVAGTIGIFEEPTPFPFVLNLAGLWAFHPGDNPLWADPEFQPADWDSLIVPGRWEDQGYGDLQDFAWYRRSFTLPASKIRDDLVIILGKIDDADQVFLNGQMIGSVGEFQENRADYDEDDWQVIRIYNLPPELIRPGEENILAVRVYDGFQYGGIFEGPIGIARSDYTLDWIPQVQVYSDAPKPPSLWRILIELLKQDQ